MKSSMRVICIVLTSLALACGGSDSGEETSSGSENISKSRTVAKPSDGNRPPEIQKMTVTPRRSQVNGQVTVEVVAVDPDGDVLGYGYQWEIDGRPLGSGKASARLSGVTKGDSVKVTAIVSDRSSEVRQSVFVKVENAPPELLVVLLKPGEEGMLNAVPRAKDLDDDPMTFTYEWKVNGNSKSVEGDSISLSKLRMGDQVTVEAQADDGDDVSEFMSSQAFTVGNVSPEIVSNPHEDAVMDSTTFRYQVKAEDANKEQRLRYRIEDGPEGMEIDMLFGEVAWTPSEDQSGEYQVTVVVEDRKGGSATQSFTVSAGGEEDTEQE